MLDPAPGYPGRLRVMLGRTMRWVIAGASAIAGGALVASCNLILGAGAYQVEPGDDGKTCGFAFAPAACASCVEASCCAQASACREDEGCAPLHDCMSGCTPGDAACRNACAAQHPVGPSNEAARALEACLSQSQTCGGACTTCGGLTDWYADGCSECVKSKCCDKAQACADDVACSERQLCYRACTYPSCPIDCDAHVAASTLLPIESEVIAGLDTCVSTGCGKQCDHGAHWDCLNDFSWPAATVAEVTFTVRATSFATALAFPGATIRVCGRADLDCSESTIKAVTDESGIARLKVPAGFTGYFDATATDTLESLVYVAWPLNSDTTYDLSLGSYELYKSLVMSGGGTVDPGTGALFIYTRDCLGEDAPGVKLDLAPPANGLDGFYFVNGSPVPLQMGTSADAIGGFANVEPGTITMMAKRVVSESHIALFTALVRVDTLTYVTLTPTP